MKKNDMAIRMTTKHEAMTNRFGFTIIELLIVVTIVGGLSSLFLVTYPGIQVSTRDARRKADTKQYQAALEAYTLKHNDSYPEQTTISSVTNICASLGLTGATCANDPLSGSGGQYKYVTDVGGSRYVLWADLERDGGGNYWIVCSGGVTGSGVLEPADSDCPLVP